MLSVPPSPPSPNLHFYSPSGVAPLHLQLLQAAAYHLVCFGPLAFCLLSLQPFPQSCPRDLVR